MCALAAGLSRPATVNLIAGIAVSTVAATVGYTFCFGVCMYLSMRPHNHRWLEPDINGQDVRIMNLMMKLRTGVPWVVPLCIHVGIWRQN